MKEYLVGYKNKNIDNFIYYDLSTINSLEKALEETKEFVIEREYDEKEATFESRALGISFPFKKKNKLVNEKIYSKDGSLKESFKEYLPHNAKILRGSLSTHEVNLEDPNNLIFEDYESLPNSLKKIVTTSEMEGNILYLAPIILSSGSKDVKMGEIYIEDNIMNIDIDIICPEVGTDDLASYLVFTFIPKAFVVNKENYIIRCIEKNKL